MGTLTCVQAKFEIVHMDTQVAKSRSLQQETALGKRNG